jgi:hypothetical protein
MIRARHLLLAGTFVPLLARGQTRTAPVIAAERIQVLTPSAGMRVTMVSPVAIDTTLPVDLILYALPNGNTTSETIGGPLTDSASWRYDIQHIGAQTRALFSHGVAQAIVAYLEADSKSWPSWRQTRGYDSANRDIVRIVDSIVDAIERPPRLTVTLTGHSGGGSFMFGFIEGQASIPNWIDRIAFLDANYNFEGRHRAPMARWLNADPGHRLIVVAYDDREIMLDGKKVVSDSGGTWRATERMLRWLADDRIDLVRDTTRGFDRWRSAQIEILRHPNPQNRILHTEMIGEMNAYLHAMLVGRPGYDDRSSVLGPPRAYSPFVRKPKGGSTPVPDGSGRDP